MINFFEVKNVIKFSVRNIKSIFRGENRQNIYHPKVTTFFGSDVMQSGFGVNFLFWSGEF